MSHPGGPKVIEAITATLGLTDDALELTWRSLAEVGNLSSASVLHVLRDTMAKRPPSGSPGVLMAMGRDSAPNWCCCVGLSDHVWYVLLIVAVASSGWPNWLCPQRNWTWSRAHGGIEFGAGHYPVMVVLHTGLLAGCLIEVIALQRPFVPALGWPMLVVVLAAQALRWWCITTLGPPVEHPRHRHPGRGARHRRTVPV